LQWPNQVYVNVEEEAPLLVWVENGTRYGVTASGRLLPGVSIGSNLLQVVSEIDPSTMSTTPSGQGTPTELLTEGNSDPYGVDQLDGEDGVVAQLPETRIAFISTDTLQGALQLSTLRPGIDQLYYRPSGGLSYQDGRGWRAYFGTGADMNQKLIVYETLVEDLLARGIQPAYISVSNQEKPYYMTQ
jgi:hypothetical protein